MKILFILKKRAGYGGNYAKGCSGLFNSANFTVETLVAAGIDARLVEVTDNNDIDREVTLAKPDRVVLEALWVVPHKFEVLAKLHPNVKWIVYIHSDLPFLAGEGVAISWIYNYLEQPNVYVAFNSKRAFEDFSAVIKNPRILYLPNCYPIVPLTNMIFDDTLRIGCFGAIRPLKNQLTQAMAAIRFADQEKKKLEFHINATRCEQGGEGILRNIRTLFADSHHVLVEHPWLNRAEFLDLLRTMNYCLAVSFSETFCIVAADAVACHVRLVCSSEIPWATKSSIVNFDTDSIVEGLEDISSFSRQLNLSSLKAYAKTSRKLWLQFLK